MGFLRSRRLGIWRRWKAGESWHEIGRAFLARNHGSIQFLLSQHGGIVPAVRRRSLRSLTLAEREDISRGIASGSSIQEDRQRISAGCVDGEPGGGASRRGVHCIEPVKPIIEAWKLAQRPKACLLARHSKLRMIVASKLILDGSPNRFQVGGRDGISATRACACPRDYLGQLIHPGSRGAEKRTDSTAAVQARSIRRSVHKLQLADSLAVRSSMPSPSARGLQKLKIRAIPGHWEGRSAQRHRQQSHRNPGGTTFAFHYAGSQSAQQGHSEPRSGCAHPAGS